MKISKVCEVCGAEFVASYMTRKYCSGSCARVAYRKRISEEKLKEQESADLIRKEEAIRSLRENRADFIYEVSPYYLIVMQKNPAMSKRNMALQEFGVMTLSY